MKRTVLVALLLACAAAQASQWVSLGKASDKPVEVLADVSSIHRSGDIARAWTKFVYVRHTERGKAENSRKWKDFALGRHAYNCSEGSFLKEALTIHYEDGSIWAEPHELIINETWEPVPPDTVFESIMKFVCAWKPK